MSLSTLFEAIERRALSDYDIVRIARDVANALAEAHSRGVAHRDLRPDNILLSGKRFENFAFSTQSDSGYRSPEQIHGQAVDARTDIFSLGVVLYRALTGRLPIAANTVPRSLASVRPDLPNELGGVVARCMEKERERRFASAAELGAALEHILPKLTRSALPTTPTPMVGASDCAIPIAAAAGAKIIEPRPRRLLVADDDAAIRRLFGTLAERQGIACDLAANGPEAIALLKQQEYALLFLDIMMPRIDGWGVLDYLRTHAAARVPALFIITAFLDQSVSAADREIVTGIIYKPIDADDISALMRTCLRGGDPSGALQRTRHRMIVSDSSLSAQRPC